MKIGFFLDNRDVTKIDFSRPWEGNPGSGASEYLQVALPYFIKKYDKSVKSIEFFATNSESLPKGILAHQVEDIRDAAKLAKNNDIDFFVFRVRIHEQKFILSLIDELKLNSIGIANLTPHPKHIRRLATSKSLKALVCVGREQYDFLMDSPVLNKIAYIDNGIHIKACKFHPSQHKNPNLVIYMGALVLQKNFHVLAEAWPKVLKEFPNAQLSVIGSAKMYKENVKLGPIGVADETYERKYILPYLLDSNGKIHSSVRFHGQMGKEKYDLIRKGMVGVVNPTGSTETCCVSAVEFSACGVATVSGAYYALLDTILHNKTGLLGRNTTDLADNIVKLLKNPDRAIKMGLAGHERANSKYDFSNIVPQWIQLFDQISKGRIPSPNGKIKNITKHYKFLRIPNRALQKTLGPVTGWPSVQEAEFTVGKFFKRLKSLKR